MDERDGNDVAGEGEDLGALMGRFKPHLGEPVGLLASEVSREDKVRVDVAARNLYKLSSAGLVKLADPHPPNSLGGYITSFHSLWFWVVAVFIALTTASIYVIPPTHPLNLIRLITGTIFTLYVPGFALVEALYPNVGDLERLERLALSVGLSLALVPLVGLVLNYTPFGIRLDPSFLSLVALVLVLCLISVYRKYTYLKLSLTASP